jgi:hypothetical protein
VGRTDAKEEKLKSRVALRRKFRAQTREARLPDIKLLYGLWFDSLEPHLRRYAIRELELGLDLLRKRGEEA